jgi:U3 small nucleolar RNA-associated protein 7
MAIPAEAKAKYERAGAKVSSRGVEHGPTRKALRAEGKMRTAAVERMVRSEILLPTEAGDLQADGRERTYRFTQKKLKAAANVGTAKKLFNLQLSFGPYAVNYTRSGSHLLLGGRKGHIAMLDCKSMALCCELQVKETVREVLPLTNHTLFAAAQKKYVYIYDHQGIEVHCLKDMKFVGQIEYLPYHWLLVAAGDTGELKYRDISTGQPVATHRTRLGPTQAMRQNPQTAVIQLGHTCGSVTLWTPNVAEPVVKFLAHKGSVTGLATSVDGNYLTTGASDGRWKVWDLRMMEKLSEFRTFGGTVSSMDVSGAGVCAVGFGCHVQFWKPFAETPSKPYMAHDVPGELVESLRFRPFEDILAVGTGAGASTAVIPGSGIANFDTFEANPYETKNQRRELQVKSVLEKLQPEMIMFNPDRLGAVDQAPRAVIEAERQAVLKAREKPKKERNKQRGKNKIGKRLKKKDEANADQVRKLIKKRSKEETSRAAAEARDAEKNSATGPKKYSALSRFDRFLRGKQESARATTESTMDIG